MNSQSHVAFTFCLYLLFGLTFSSFFGISENTILLTFLWGLSLPIYFIKMIDYGYSDYYIRKSNGGGE